MIELRQLDLAGIDVARTAPSDFDGLAVSDGGLPPSSILDEAAAALRAGGSSRWFAPVLFVDPQRRRIVGSAIFKGPPSAGWVAIGYGVADGERRRGYGTEGVFALVRIAFERADVHTVYAETSVTNHASRRLVQKVGFAWAGARTSEEDGPLDCWFVEASWPSVAIRQAKVTGPRRSTPRPSR